MVRRIPIWTLLLLPYIVPAGHAAASTNSLDAQAPATICGGLNIDGSTMGYHYSTRDGSLDGTILRGFHETLTDRAIPPTQTPTLGRPLPSGTRISIVAGSQVTLELEGRARLAAAEAIAGPCRAEFALGPPPSLVFGRPSERDIDEWHLVPAVPEESFVVIPLETIQVAAPLTLTVHEGEILVQDPDSEPTRHQAGVKRQVPAALLDDPTRERTTQRIQIEEGSVTLLQTASEETLAYWAGERDVQDPLALMPGRFVPRHCIPHLDERLEDWALPTTSFGLTNATLYPSGPTTLRGVHGSDESALTLHATRIRPISAAGDARHFTAEVTTETSPYVFATQAPGRDIVPGWLLVFGAAGLVSLATFHSAIPTRWLRALGLGLPARLRKEEAAEHPIRSAILQIAHERPGLGKLEMANAVGCGWGNILYHLRLLERYGLVRLIRIDRHVRIFAVNGEPEHAHLLASFERNPTSSRILAFLRASPGADQQSVAANIGRSAPTVWWNLQRLIRAGIVEQTRRGRHVSYALRKTAPTSNEL